MPKPAPDLLGRRFGKLIVTASAGQLNRRKAWLCLCDCGNYLRTRASSLMAGFTTSCGCHRIEVALKNIDGVGEKNFQNVIGKRFGRLIAIEVVGKNNGGFHRWRCQCDCGKETITAIHLLNEGRTKSCGCLQKEFAKTLRERMPNISTIHGHALKQGGSPTYSSYNAMLARCYNRNVVEFSRYGGRGITVCSRWKVGEAKQTGFQCFLNDMGERPSTDYTLDRIDVNGNYEPDNCRWATRKQQARNKIKTHKVQFNGELFVLADLIDIGIVTYNQMNYRMHVKKMPLQEAFDAARLYKK